MGEMDPRAGGLQRIDRPARPLATPTRSIDDGRSRPELPASVTGPRPAVRCHPRRPPRRLLR